MHAQTRLEQFGVDIHMVTTREDWKILRNSDPKFKQMMKKPQSDGRAQLIPSTNEYEATVVFYINLDDDNTSHISVFELINTCAHEARHGTDFALESIGQHVAGADEVAAYLTGWLTAWLYENCDHNNYLSRKMGA